MYRGQGVHIRGARGEEGVRRDIGVGSRSRPESTLGPSTRLLVYRLRLVVDDTTWFSGVDKKCEQSTRVRSQHAGRRGGNVRGRGYNREDLCVHADGGLPEGVVDGRMLILDWRSGEGRN